MTKRIFTAIELSQELKDLLRSLEIPGIYWVRWMDSANFHVTLNFLGNLSSAQIEVTKEVVGATVQGYEPFDLVFKEAVGKPNMLWLLPERNRELIYLQTELKQALREKRIGKSERRQYQPHVLLARPKNPRLHISSHKMQKVAKDWHKQHFEPVTVRIKEVGIFESELLPGGAKHTLLSRHQLGGSNEG